MEESAFWSWFVLDNIIQLNFFHNVSIVVFGFVHNVNDIFFNVDDINLAIVINSAWK